jgi:hypothetical protein
MSHPYTLNISTNDAMFGFPGLIAAAAGGSSNPPRNSSFAGFSTAGVPGFNPPDPGTFAVYRRISAHLTVALAMSIVTSPIVANSWGWSKRKNTPAHWLDFAKEILEPMRTTLLTDSLRALAFGFAAFEKIWETDGRRIVLKKLKPLLPEITQILSDRHGNFVGLRNQPPGDPPRDLKGPKAFLYTYDGEFGNFYGRSRHENIREVWSQALQTVERMAQYHKKIAGVIAQLHYPEGTSRDAAGVERSNDLIAQQILEAVAMGKSVRFPNLFASIDDPTTAADLAGKSQWVLSQFDPGGKDYSPGLLNALAYYDRLLFRGWLRPERVGLESSTGTRADAEQHSETSVLDSELIDRNFAAAFNAGVVDDLLTINFGPSARGAVWIEPSPISDIKSQAAQAVLVAMLRNAHAGPVAAQSVDIPALLQDLDLPSRPSAG